MSSGSLRVTDDPCKSNEDCHSTFEFCNMSTLLCEHKDVFPMEIIEFIGTFVLTILIALANASGIGGGVVVVLIVRIFFGFTHVESVPISQASIVVASFVRLFLNWNKKHPYKPKTMVDYDMAVIMMPAMMLGSGIGVLLRSVLAGIIQSFLLFLILVYSAYKSLKKGVKTYQGENKKIREGENLVLDPAGKPVYLNPSHEEYKSEEPSMTELRDTMDNPMRRSVVNKRLQKIYYNENTHFYWKKAIPIVLVFLFLVAQNLLRGSSQVASIVDFDRCSVGDWTTLAVYVALCFLSTIVMVYIVQKEYAHKERSGYTFHETDLRYNFKNSSYLAFISFMAGVITAIAGISGSSILTPLMLELNVDARVAGDTAMILVLFSSIANCSQFIIGKELNWPFSIFSMCFVGIGTLSGLVAINKAIKATGRTSIIILLLALVLGMSAGTTLIVDSLLIAERVRDGQDIFDFKPYCP